MYIKQVYRESSDIWTDILKLIFTILIIQLIAIFGAYFFAYVSRLRGNKFSLVLLGGMRVLGTNFKNGKEGVFTWSYYIFNDYFQQEDLKERIDFELKTIKNT